LFVIVSNIIDAIISEQLLHVLLLNNLLVWVCSVQTVTKARD